MVSNVGRSKISLMLVDAKPYAASKSPRRKASSWRVTVAAAAVTSEGSWSSATRTTRAAAKASPARRCRPVRPDRIAGFPMERWWLRPLVSRSSRKTPCPLDSRTCDHANLKSHATPSRGTAMDRPLRGEVLEHAGGQQPLAGRVVVAIERNDRPACVLGIVATKHRQRIDDLHPEAPGQLGDRALIPILWKLPADLSGMGNDDHGEARIQFIGQGGKAREVGSDVIDPGLIEVTTERGRLEVVAGCPRDPGVVRPADERARPCDLTDRPPAHDVAAGLRAEIERVPVQMLEALPPAVHVHELEVIQVEKEQDQIGSERAAQQPKRGVFLIDAVGADAQVDDAHIAGPRGLPVVALDQRGGQIGVGDA